jgi:hypothetical protein
VVKSHHSASGIRIEAAIKLQVMAGGISSASRQKTVDRNDVAGLLERSVPRVPLG